MTNDSAGSPVGWSGYARFSLDDLAALQPGLTIIMPLIGERYWKLYHAAKAGNWDMAKYQAEQVRALMETGSVTRPDYARDLEAFLEGYLEPIEEAIMGQDWEAFEEAYNDGRAGITMYHDKNKRPFIKWRLPEDAPPDLDLRP